MDTEELEHYAKGAKRQHNEEHANSAVNNET